MSQLGRNCRKDSSRYTNTIKHKYIDTTLTNTGSYCSSSLLHCITACEAMQLHCTRGNAVTLHVMQCTYTAHDAMHLHCTWCNALTLHAMQYTYTARDGMHLHCTRCNALTLQRASVRDILTILHSFTYVLRRIRTITYLISTVLVFLNSCVEYCTYSIPGTNLNQWQLKSLHVYLSNWFPLPFS